MRRNWKVKVTPEVLIAFRKVCAAKLRLWDAELVLECELGTEIDGIDIGALCAMLDAPRDAFSKRKLTDNQIEEAINE